MHTNLSWCKAILTNTLPQHAAVGCPNVHWFGPTYRRQTQILCSAEWMFHFPTLRFLVFQSSPGPLEDFETTGFSFLLPTMEAFCCFQYFEAGCSMNNLFWTGLPPPIWFCPGFAQQANGSSLRDNAILWLVAHAHWQQCFESLGPHSYTMPVCFVGLVELFWGNFQTKCGLLGNGIGSCGTGLGSKGGGNPSLRFHGQTFVFVLMWTSELPSLYICMQKKCQYLIGHSRPACTATMRKFSPLWPPGKRLIYHLGIFSVSLGRENGPVLWTQTGRCHLQTGEST